MASATSAPGRVAGGFDRLTRSGQVPPWSPGTSGAKPPSSPSPVGKPCFFRTDLSEWNTSAPQRSASVKVGGADRRDHELLHVDARVGVGAAVEDVHHRHRQTWALGPAEIAEQGQPGGLRRGLGHRQRHPQDRVRAQLRLVGRAVGVEQRLVDEPLVVGARARRLPARSRRAPSATALRTPLPP